jgi:D-beta-D-heptose 7-phosphate kinase/D-beta-D-heptose 1-phosphate adenosyltransferase
MKAQLPAFESGRVLVVGDVMLDRYVSGDTSRISPEAPVPVVRVEREEERPGGAGNVALNIAALGSKAEALCVTGDDAAARVLEERLSGAGVDCLFQRLPGFPTITKLRVLSRHQQLIRLDFEDGFAGFDDARLVMAFEERLGETDVVVLSDYGKGTLRPIRRLIDAARAAGKPVLVDPKNRDFSIYRGATLITPNLNEFEAVVGPCADEAELVDKGTALLGQQDLEALLITRGEHGMTLLREGCPELHLPARAREVFDVTGAGDTVIAVLAAALAAGKDLPSATALANTAAGIVVGKLGAATVSVPELRRALQDGQEIGSGVLSEDQLMVAVADARDHGETIVMTNGCFDILHAGHVAYLEESKRLGDRLIVAVNTDESVVRLKGPGRPVNPVERRMAVLAALASVDWVAPFSEETPERLICRVAPDYLVKGGDNRPEDIPGAKCVNDNGGRVLVMTYLDGVSTTRLIETIQSKEH